MYYVCMYISMYVGKYIYYIFLFKYKQYCLAQNDHAFPFLEYKNNIVK